MMRFRTTKKKTMALGAVVTLLAFAGPAKTHASTELGDMCWNLSPFIDTLRINITQADLTDAGLFQSLHGRWRASGAYQIPASGHMSDSDAVPGALAFGVSGSLGSAGTNEAIALYANLDPITMSGPWSLVVASTSPVFRNTGTLVPITCDATMGPATVGSGNALGR